MDQVLDIRITQNVHVRCAEDEHLQRTAVGDRDEEEWDADESAQETAPKEEPGATEPVVHEVMTTPFLRAAQAAEVPVHAS